MNNTEFLQCVGRSFTKFLETHPRSNQKLKVLHGEIATDLSVRLGKKYTIKSLGYEKSKEGKIQGRYINKNVDITVYKDGVEIAGIAVKFVMQNYSQNSNNYFENMLGETANIRSSNIPYFQIFIIPEIMPYYKKDGVLKKWEKFTSHNSGKYKIISEDNVETSLHTPTKTLLYVIQLPAIKGTVRSKSEYDSYYLSLKKLVLEVNNTDNKDYYNNIILNDYDNYATKIVHRIKSI